MIRYLSAADASKLLGVTPGGVRLMVRRGELPVAAVTEGGIKLFNPNDVAELARRRIVLRDGSDLSVKSEHKSSATEEPSNG